MDRYTDEQVRTIVEVMRDDGETVMLGGSRCHETYFWRGRWVCDSFDEGSTSESDISEDTLRRLIESDPAAFLHVLRRRPWRRFVAAFRAGDRASARAALVEARAYADGLSRKTITIVDAALAWPEERPSSEAMLVIAEAVLWGTAYHAFMESVLWDKTPENARRGVAFMDTLQAIAGESHPLCGTRALLREEAGDIAGAIADLERECTLAPPTWAGRPGNEQKIAWLRLQPSGPGPAPAAVPASGGSSD